VVNIKGVTMNYLLLPLLFCLFIFGHTGALATTYYSQNSGDPTNTSIWNTSRTGSGSTPAGFGATGDAFVVQSGHTMTNASQWTFNCANGTLQIESGGILTANAVVDLVPSATFQIDNGGTYNHNFSGTAIFDGTESFGATSQVTFLTNPTTSALSVLSFGNLAFNYSSGGNFRFNSGTSSTIAIAGDLTIANTSNSGSDEVRCATGSSNGVTLSIGGDFIISGGTFDFYSASGGSNGNINIGGDLVLSGGTWTNDGANNLTVNFSTGNSDITATFGATVISGVVDDADWAIDQDKTVNMLSNWEIGSGESLLVNGRLNFSSYYVHGSGSISVTASGTLGIGHTSGIDANSTDGNIRFTLANRSMNPGCAIVYNGSGAQATGTGLDDIGTLTGTLTISNTGNEVALSTNLAFGDGFNLIVSEGAELVMESSDEIVKASGSNATITCNGTIQVENANGFSALATGGDEAFQGFTACSFGSNGTILYNGTGNQTITNQFTYRHLQLWASNVSASANNKTLGGSLDIDGNLSVEGTADLDMGAYSINLAGNWTREPGTDFSPGSGTVVFDGIDQSISNDGTETFFNLSISVSGTVTSNDPIDISNGGALSINNGTFDLGTNKLQSTSTNRTLSMSSGTLRLAEANASTQPNFGTLSITGGTIILAAAGAMELKGGQSYHHLTFSGSGTKTISSATPSVGGTVYITESCTLIVSNKTFGGASTSLTMDGGYFSISGSGTKPDMEGTYTLTGGTIEFGGSASQTIRSPRTYYQVLVSGTSVGGSSGDYTLASGGTFTVGADAIFSVTDQKITTSGSATVVINGTFTTADEDGLSGGAQTSITSSINNFAMGVNSTIQFSRTGNQSITARTDYANLTISGSGVKTFGGPVAIAKDYTLLGGGTVYGSTVSFTGSAAQSIAGDHYDNATVVLSGGGQKNMQGNVTILGDITFTNGVLALGNNDLTIGASSAVSSASASSFVLINGTGRLSRTISNGSAYVFPIGENGASANTYIPMTVECDICTGEELAVGVENTVYVNPSNHTSQTFSAAGYSNYVDKTWDLSTDGIAGDLSITLQWNAGDQTTNPGSNNSNNTMGIGLWESGVNTSWTTSTLTNSGVSGSIYTQVLNKTGLNNAKYYFAIGSGSTPLPVVLSRFEVQCGEHEVVAQWTTATEANASHFVLESTSDGLQYSPVGQVTAAGYSFNPTPYQLSIPRLQLGNAAFFRLTQYDLDGLGTIYPNYPVNCGLPNTQAFGFYGGQLTIDHGQPATLWNISGQLLAEQVTQCSLLPGMYVLQVGTSFYLLAY
jgi:hypothetical protein